MATETNMRRRPGFTLIEMLVVLGIILLLSTLAVIYYPKLQDSQQMIRASDKVVQALGNARQRAKRDGLPTGVRFEVDPTTGYITQFEYIQQPDNFSFGNCQGSYPIPKGKPSDPQTYNNSVVDFALPSGVDFQGAAVGLNVADQSPVQPGDYLEVFGGGGVFRVIGAIPKPPGTGFNSAIQINYSSTPDLNPLIYPTSNYRIIRQPRKLIGEDPITLPKNFVLDTGLIPSSNAIPMRLMTVGPLTVAFNEILFSPSGSVIGRGTGGDKIILWLRDLSQPTLEAPDPYAGSPVLISIQVRTGFISANPVALPPATDPFLYTKDPCSSGM
jgi:prepilin-type N-terminal cleavage/methylation domain-containing protein